MIQAVGNGATTTFGYDYQGQRVFSQTASSTTVFPSKYFSVTSRTVATTTYATTTSYIWSGDTLVAYIEQPQINGVATGTPQTFYVHPDHLGSTNVITNASGTVVTSKDYYPFGSVRVESGDATMARGYIGQFQDENLLYLQARYMDPARGQFMSQDPTYLAIGSPSAVRGMSGISQSQLLADPQAMNSYAYALNNPIRYTDKNGKFIDIPWISNNQWVQESATAAYQQSGTWRFAMDHPNTTAAIVGVAAIPALYAGSSATAAFSMAAYPGVGATFASQQTFAGLVYSALAVDSTLAIPGIVGAFGQADRSKPSSFYSGAWAITSSVGPSAIGGYPGAFADAFQFAGLLNKTLGAGATNLYSGSVQTRSNTVSTFNSAIGSGSGGGMPSGNSLWMTPSGAVVNWTGNLVAPPPSK